MGEEEIVLINEMNRKKGVRGSVLAIVAAALMSPVVFLGALAASPSVALAAPEGIFAVFAQCPTSVPGLGLCEHAEITSGELVLGSMPIPIPIENTIILQGGALPTGALNQYVVLPAVNGESLSQTEQDIPGGLRSILNCKDIRSRFLRYAGRVCRALFHGRLNEVSAVIEPVASIHDPAILDLGNVAFEEGTGLTLPIRVHLQNPLLGDECYVGSEAQPIQLRLTTGTTSPPPPNQPITGKAGQFAEEEEEGYVSVKNTNNTLVDNTFSVPPATGCGGQLAAFIDPLINHALGLESPAGHNTAILNSTHEIAPVGAVLASEKFPAKENPSPPSPPHHHHHQWWTEQ
jgi:hypothetical protein